MKKRILTTVLCVLTVLACAIAFVACRNRGTSGGNENVDGTYYLYANGALDKNDYIKLESGTWSSSGNEKGNVEVSGNSVKLYVTFFGETKEYCSGVVENGVFRIGRFNSVNIDYKYYCKNGKTPPANAPVHNLMHTAAVAETCTKDGNIEYWTCIACGLKFTDERGTLPTVNTIIKAKGHSYGDWTLDTAATCTQNGRNKRTCSACDDVDYDLITADGHDPVGSYQTTNTVHYQICQTCGKHAGEESHTYGTNNVCMECGYEVLAHDKLSYNLSDDKSYSIVTGWNLKETQLFLPAYHSGKEVVLGSTLGFHDSSFERLILCDGIKQVGTQSFTYIAKLKDVIIPSSVESMGMFVFQGCESLTDIWCEVESKPSGWNSNWYSTAGSSSPKVHWGGEWRYVHGSPVLNSVTDVDEDAHVYTKGWVQDSDEHWHEAVCGCSGVPNKDVAEHSFDAEDHCIVCGYNLVYSTNLLSFSQHGDEYTVNGKATMVADSELENLVIPDTYLGLPVTSIAANAFKNNTSIKSVRLPDSVKTIGANAFDGCTGVISVTIGGGVTSIGANAFNGCNIETAKIPTSVIPHLPKNKLNSVTITSGTSIPDNAFDGCDKLTNVKIGDSVTSIGWSAFYGCSGLTSIEIADSVTSIEGYAFYRCSSLTSIKIPNSVTSIWTYAFGDCSSLTSITIPNSVTSIEGGAFYNCSSLTSIEIPNSVTSIGIYAFNGCNSLASIEIPNSVTSIGGKAFYGSAYYNNGNNWRDGVLYINKHLIKAGYNIIDSYKIAQGTLTIADEAFSFCSNLTSIEIPNSVMSIGEYTFNGCNSLTSIEIPNSVTSIGEYAFYDCSSLTGIELPNSVTSIGKYAFNGCTGLTSVEIPNSVTSIGNGAFSGCSGLTSIELPNSVTSIGEYAFSYCSNLTSIKFNGTKAQWKAISKDWSWNGNTGNYTVTCTDGTLTKSESEENI